jgi:putative hydrolase of the HAD superfamily
MASPIPIDAILFDLDDTLHDRAEAFRRWAAGFVVARFEGTDDAVMREALAFLISADDHGHCLRPEFGAKVKAHFPLVVTESVDDFVAAFQLGIVAQMELADDVGRQLDRLDERQMPWGIVTNGATVQQTRKIVHLGLGGRPACLIISEAFGRHKPDREIFLAAADSLGTHPNRTLFVGDNVRNDILGAAQTGMLTAWMRCGREWPEELADTPPDFAIDAIGELDQYLN